MSGASKLFALAITYPYQVIRSRLQVGPSFRLSVSRVSRILALHRTTPRRTYTPISPPPSNERGKAKVFKVSTVASEQTLFASSLGPVSRLSCMRIWRGCFGRPLSGGNRGGRAARCCSSRPAGKLSYLQLVTSRHRFRFRTGIITLCMRSQDILIYLPTHPFISQPLDEYMSNSESESRYGSKLK
jgi:hypothetical protein